MAELLLEELTIRTTEGLRSFRVEVARTNKEQSTGLTGREKLAPDRGMLFDLGTERQINMWMRNTSFSLDILFLGKSGKITSIVSSTTPYSVESIPSKGEVVAVLELVAGARLGIMVGDKVYHSIFKST
jgi:uncharacterized membrane protein (UPF0127 family)|tara:strand:+ start:15 stop:401 length:387 start_codon:yes stop_codon:yes gene_type:complete